MSQSRGYDSYVGKLGIGFDPVLDLIKSVDESTSLEDVTAIPPYNIKKAADGGYVLELDLTGVDRGDITATLDADHLTISATTKVGFDAASSDGDVYFHQGILAGGKVSAKFLVAHNLAFKEANLDDGILSVVFNDTNSPRTLTTLPIGPLPKSDTPYTVEYDAKGSPVMVPAGSDPNSTDAVPLELPTVEDQQAAVATPPTTAPVDTAPADTTQVTVNADTTAQPTVTVNTPTVVPPVVQATVSAVVNAPVSNSSDQPQATVTVTPATDSVAPDSTLTVVKTDPDKPDVVVAVDPASAATAASAGIDVPAAVSAALDHPDVTVAPADPAPVVSNTIPVPVAASDSTAPAVEVQVPDTVTPVVNVTPAVQADNSGSVPAVAITPSDGTDVPKDSVMVPVVTQDGASNVVAAVSPDAHDALTNAGVDPSAALSQAVQAAAPDVPHTPDVPVPVLTNDQNPVVATTTVELPKELPQVVTAEATDVKPVVNPAAAEPQATVTVSDATHEIVSDNVVTTVAKTPDTNADVVVAVDADHQADMKAQGVDVLQSAKDAIELAPAGVTLPTPPPAQTEATKDNAPADVVVQPSADASAAPVTVSVPDTLQSVVQATVSDDNKVVLSDTQGQVPADATLTPVVTAADQHDIVVATTPDTDKKLDDLGVDVSKDVSKAVVAADTPVVTSTDVAAPLPVSSDTPADVPSTPVVQVDATAEAQSTTPVDSSATPPPVAPSTDTATADATTVAPPATDSVAPASVDQNVAPAAPAADPAPTTDNIASPVTDTSATPAVASDPTVTPATDPAAAPVEQQAPDTLVANTSSDLQ